MQVQDLIVSMSCSLHPPPTKFWGVYWFDHGCLSICVEKWFLRSISFSFLPTIFTEMKFDLYQKGGKLDFESLPMAKMKCENYTKMMQKGGIPPIGGFSSLYLTHELNMTI